MDSDRTGIGGAGRWRVFVVCSLVLLTASGCSLPDEALDSAGTVFIAVHMEPTFTGKGDTFPGSRPYDPRPLVSADYVSTLWPTLQGLVKEADEQSDANIRLNLLFNPQWGDFIIRGPDCEPGTGFDTCLEEVHAWEADGHAIGLHHHGMYHGTWNGFTNLYEWVEHYAGQDCNGDDDDGTDRETPQDSCTRASDPFFLADVARMMRRINPLSASGSVRAGTVSPESVKEALGGDSVRAAYTDWPNADMRYHCAGIEMPAHLVSKPICQTYGNSRPGESIAVAELSMALFSDSERQLDLIGTALEDAEDGEVVGIVFHVEQFHGGQRDDIIALFDWLNDAVPETKTLETIVDEQITAGKFSCF